MADSENQSDQASMSNFIQRWLGAKSETPGVALQLALKCARSGGVLCGRGGAGRVRATLWVAMALLTAVPAWAANTLNWETNRNRVSADIKGGKLVPLLEQIASATGDRKSTRLNSSHLGIS